MSSTASKRKVHTVSKRRDPTSHSSTNDSKRLKLGMNKREVGDPVQVFDGSGNVWADLGFPDAAERKVKADLAFAIRQRIEVLRLTQVQAAERLRLTQPKVSDLINLRTKGYSIERLAALLMRLGATVEVTVSFRKSGNGFRVRAA
jgi:predicted XRE-type DNA-binding protein